MQKTIRNILVVLMLLTSIRLPAQVKIYATVSPAVIHKNELAAYTLVIENSSGITNIDPPSFVDFTLLSGPNEESTISINGTVKILL